MTISDAYWIELGAGTRIEMEIEMNPHFGVERLQSRP